MSTQETDSDAPIAFARSTPLLGTEFALFAQLLRKLGAILLTFFGFFVEQVGLRCRASSAGQPADNNLIQVLAAADGYLITNRYVFAWLDPNSVDMHLSTGDGLSGDRTCPEEACRP